MADATTIGNRRRNPLPQRSASFPEMVRTSNAPSTRHTATKYRPMRLSCVVTLSHPTAYGETNPARLPTQLIPAIPTATEVPARNDDGMLQNNDSADNMPAAATLNQITASVGW